MNKEELNNLSIDELKELRTNLEATIKNKERSSMKVVWSVDYGCGSEFFDGCDYKEAAERVIERMEEEINEDEYSFTREISLEMLRVSPERYNELCEYGFYEKL